MQAGTLVALDEYLNTSYRPDCEYLDGILLERNVGEHDHSRLQMLLSSYLFTREAEWGIHVVPEQRVQVKPARFRVPDICVLAHDAVPAAIYTQPPFLCIEILSKDDTMREMLDRVEDYLAFGVPYVWVIDPGKRRAWIYTGREIRVVTDGVLRTSDPDISVPLTEILT